MTTKTRTNPETKPEPKATNTAPAALTFEDADRPQTIREPKVNPYAAAIKALAESAGEDGVSAGAKAVTHPADQVDSHIVLMQKAGRAHGVTVRNRQEKQDDGTVRVTFWTVPRITRKAKDDETAK